MIRHSHKSVCPVEAMFRILMGPWTMYLLWTLRQNGPTRFGAIKRKLEGISSKVLTERLRLLEREGLIYRDHKPTIPPGRCHVNKIETYETSMQVLFMQQQSLPATRSSLRYEIGAVFFGKSDGVVS